MAIDIDEFDICERRGHEPSGRAVTLGVGPTYQYCAHCDVRYYMTEPEVRYFDADVGALINARASRTPTGDDDV